MKYEYERSSGNVFEDLGFDSAEAALLKVKSGLLSALGAYVARFESQADAASSLGVKQPRISEIANGKLSAFSTDLLIKLCDRAGIDVTLATEVQRE